MPIIDLWLIHNSYLLIGHSDGPFPIVELLRPPDTLFFCLKSH